MMSCGRTVTWPPSMHYLMHYMTRKWLMFLLFPPVLLPVLLPCSFPSLKDQALQSVHPHLDQVLQGGAGTTGLMEKKLRAASWENSWLAGGARSLSSRWDILSHLLPGFSLWKEFFSRYRSFNIVFPESTIIPILEYLAVLLVPHY